MISRSKKVICRFEPPRSGAASPSSVRTRHLTFLSSRIHLRFKPFGALGLVLHWKRCATPAQGIKKRHSLSRFLKLRVQAAVDELIGDIISSCDIAEGDVLTGYVSTPHTLGTTTPHATTWFIHRGSFYRKGRTKNGITNCSVRNQSDCLDRFERFSYNRFVRNHKYMIARSSCR